MSANKNIVYSRKDKKYFSYMLLRLFIISFCWFAVTGCSANAQQKIISNINSYQAEQNLNIPKDKLANPALNQQAKIINSKISDLDTNRNLSSSANANNFFESKGNAKSKKVSVGAGGAIRSYMTLIPTEKSNQLGNPLYELRLFANGQQVASYMTVSGRAHTQTRDRNRSGTEAPLPDGRYKIAKSVIRGTIPEAGDRFLGLQPTFRTGRTDLGIHYDPSFNLNNNEDGTSGCIALTNREELTQVLNFVRTYKPQFLEVSIR
ncbi:L,D-transpeptidase [Calothrix sp. UHCC 0171]|uniref:L,D-transpeptidase n=1 Tax=Calothrix sp. UHCC 0171 TaxID=3110245 RepID=UPI002B1F808E|nr:L,D-transpeptidase [Calothrix sp. UHCC 0171]MEA5571450.1 L,D-transpeptidase [Calothrix sp. UHCC 0171]